jgi:hypothetical protein
MNSRRSMPRYNRPIPQMRARTSSGLRLGWLTAWLFAALVLPSSLFASDLTDSARQLAHKIAAASGPGAFAVTITNRSSIDSRSVTEIRSALETELQAQGVHSASADQGMGTIEIVFSESLSDYVWTAAIAVGSDEKRIAMVATPRPQAAITLSPSLPIVLRPSLLLAQEQAMLDVALVEMPGGARLIVLERDRVAIYHRATNGATRWELEAALPITHTRAFPRDLRGRLMLRRDHLFDVYLPGTFCRSSAAAPLTLACNATDDPWPLTPDDASIRAFNAASRNFFTGALSPGIGKIATVPSFYSAGQVARTGYSLWALAGVDGALHLVDGMTDQTIPGSQWGSDLAAVRSNCGVGTQLLVSDSGDSDHDALRALEIPDRDPVAVSAANEFSGRIVALWTDGSGGSATAIVKRKDTGWYEAYRVSISCGN